MYNIEGIIKNNAAKLKYSRRDIEIAPDISQKKRNNWIKKYHNKVDAAVGENLIFLSDTKMGSIAVTGKGLYFDNFLQGGLQYLEFVNIKRVAPVEGGIFRPDKIEIDTIDGSSLYLDGCIDGIDIKLFSKIINKIVVFVKENGTDLVSSKQDVALYEVADELKLIYLEILCNYAYMNGNLIDADEYTAISNFIVRMELGSDTRKVLREYMNSISDRLKTGNLLYRAKEFTKYETGQWDAFRYSLLQDVLYIHELKKPGESWREDGFVGSLLNHSSLKPAQVDVMLKAVGMNRRMQEKGCDYTAIKKEWVGFFKDIRYTEGYVPSKYLFCSGSVYGINCFDNFFAADDNSQKGINKKREVILQEIILNNQKTLSILADDMHDIALRLEYAINKGGEYREKYETLIARLKTVSEKTRDDISRMEGWSVNAKKEDSLSVRRSTFRNGGCNDRTELPAQGVRNRKG